jgi:hypothetical protein
MDFYRKIRSCKNIYWPVVVTICTTMWMYSNDRCYWNWFFRLQLMKWSYWQEGGPHTNCVWAVADDARTEQFQYRRFTSRDENSFEWKSHIRKNPSCTHALLWITDVIPWWTQSTHTHFITIKQTLVFLRVFLLWRNSSEQDPLTVTSYKTITINNNI